MPAGRPKKYNRASLQKAVNRYFSSISRMETLRDEAGNPITNEAGERMRRRVYYIPAAKTALALHLGIDRSTLQDYADERKNPQLAPIIRHAYAMIEAFLEEELLTRRKGISGIIFNLQNNYGWKEKKEVALEEKTRASLSVSGMSMEEKLSLLTRAGEIAAGVEGEGHAERGEKEE